MKWILNLRRVFVVIWALALSQASSAQSLMLNDFPIVEELYENEQYEQAFKEYKKIYKERFQALDLNNQALILDWGIRLSYIAEDWESLDKYVGLYYELDPYFSASSLKEFSPQLEEYINNYVRSQSEQFVYVNKHRQNVDLIPSTVTVYTKSDIEELGVRNLLDLIRLTPGFAEIGDNNERLIGTRGSSSTTLQDVLFLINGHRINDVLTNTTAPDWISLDYVEQIELVRGPGSALYGGSAFSGVVNIITKNGRFQNINRLNVDVGNGNTFRSMKNIYNTYKMHYEYGRKINNTEGIYFSGTYFISGGSEKDYSQLDDKIVLPDVRDTTTLRQADVNGKEYINAYAPGYNLLMNYHREALQITANAQSSKYLYSRPGSFNTWEKQDREIANQQRRRNDKREFIQLEYDLFSGRDKSNIGDLRLKVSGDHFKKDFYTTVNSFGIDGNTRLVGDEFRGTMNVEFSSDSLFGNQGTRKSHLLMGLEGFVNHWFYQYYVEEDSNLVLNSIEDQFSKPGDDRLEYIGAFYMQTEQHIVNDVLVATFGVRLNYHSEYSRFDEFKWGEQYSPRFALVLNPGGTKDKDRFKFKLMYNSAFLPPPFLYRKGGISQFVGSTDLNVQNIESGEFAMSGNINNYFSYNLQTYVNKINNFIERVGNRYVNDATGLRNSGFEAELWYKRTFEKWKVNAFANYTFVKQQNFKDSIQTNFLDAFQAGQYENEDVLVNFPSNKFTLGFFGTTINKVEKSEKSTSNKPNKITFGADLQWIGRTNIVNSYYVSDQGLLESYESAQKQQISPISVVNARVKIHWTRFSFGLSSFNLLGAEYFLPSVISRIKRQKAEGRMIFLNLNYRLRAI